MVSMGTFQSAWSFRPGDSVLVFGGRGDQKMDSEYTARRIVGKVRIEGIHGRELSADRRSWGILDADSPGLSASRLMNHSTLDTKNLPIFEAPPWMT